MKFFKVSAHGNIMHACGQYAGITDEEKQAISKQVIDHLEICKKLFEDSFGCCFSLIVLPSSAGDNIHVDCGCGEKVWERDYE